MKATGVVRRIDELGRVVIPKEIRRILRLREGSEIEIFTDDQGSVIFKKFSATRADPAFSEKLCRLGARTAGAQAGICSRDGTVELGTLRELRELTFSESLVELMENRREFGGRKELSEGICLTRMCPIISGGDLLGGFFTVNGPGNDREAAVCRLCADVLGAFFE